MGFRTPIHLRSLFPFLARRRRSSLSGSSSFSSHFSRLARKKKWTKLRVFQVAATVLFVGTVVSILGFFGMVAYFSQDLPDPNTVVRKTGFSTRITDRSGTILYDLFMDERRTPIAIDQVPKYLQHATVAIEDKDFYNHAGVDPLTPFRITWNYFRQGKLAGGSTLTQQLVKNVLLSSERSVTRKLREVILATQIERQFSKEQILQMYFNEAPYGGTAVGVGAAAEVYFNKPVKDLSLTESAILAGLPQRPSAYSPYSGKTDTDGTPLWQVRTRGVLRRMREDGYITKDQEEFALAELPSVQFNNQAVKIRAPHFVMYVKEKLEELYGAEMVEQGGLRVTTSLDLAFQDKAQSIVAKEIEGVTRFNITNGSAVVMDPNSGEILAMVGSKDYFAKDYDGQFNVATDGLRQPGSSIKPMTYLLALRKGLTPGSMIADTPTQFVPKEGDDVYEPRNYDGKFHGPVSMRVALASSLNIPAVKLLARVGVENMLRSAYDMGFVTLEPTPENMRRFGLSVTLGGGEVHLLDTVTAYSAFANGGTKISPVAILKVEDRNGKVIYESKPVKGKQVVTPQEAFLINHMLSDNSARSLTFGPNSLLNFGGRAVAVKTGTTNNRKDNWTVGWSRNTMVGVWVGNNNNSEMTNVASGVTGASPIWRKIMNEAITGGRKVEDWVIPAGVEAVRVDAVSGYPAHDGFPEKAEYVMQNTLPSLPDPIHSKIKVCKSDGKLASEVDIQRGDYDEKEFVVMREADAYSKDGVNRWQAGIDQWIASLAADQQPLYKPPTELCGTKDQIVVNIKSPGDKQTLSTTEVVVEISTASEGDIDRVEVFANGSLKATTKERPYKATLSLPAGRYVLSARAVRTDGKDARSSDVLIGTAGVSWQEPTPTPSPSPTPTPTATPLSTPAPVL